MQKIINGLVVVNFVFAGVVTGALVYGYANRDKVAEQARERLTNLVVEAVGGIVPDMMDDMIPDVSGPAMPPIKPSIPGM